MKQNNEKFCMECGKLINIKAEICPLCGVRQNAQFYDPVGEKSIGHPFLGTLLIGSFYFLIKANYIHALISAILAIGTGGFAWFIYPFFARSIMTKFYEEKGYTVTG